MRQPMIIAALATCAGLAGPSVADAAIYFGNPQLGFRVDRPQGDYIDGVVDLTKARVHHCDGTSTDYAIGQDVDPVAGHHITISGGDHCAVTWFWGSELSIDGGTSSSPYTVEVTDVGTYVILAEDIGSVAMDDWQVVAGTMSGGGPWVLTWIQ